MIGNTDFAVPRNRNIKFIRSKTDTVQRPFTVPYDFDYSGVVNAPYAIPPPELPIKFVTQRLYRGFPRTMVELQAALELFRQQKSSIDSLINHFEPLQVNHKNEMIKYLAEFFEIIDDEKIVNDLFIKNARKE